VTGTIDATDPDFGRSGLPIPLRAMRAWRVVFGVYAGALSMGTHWPRLALGDPTNPPDKMLHAIAFGGLTLLLWQARFVRSLAALALVAVLWTIVDELTQAIPGLGRSISMQDVVASNVGVAIALGVLWATRPRGGALSRLRRARFDRLMDLALSTPNGWMAFLSSASLGAMIGMVAAILIDGRAPDPSPFQAGVVGLVFGAAAVGPAFLLHGMSVREAGMLERRLCLGCGAPDCADDACGRCGARPLAAQWLPAPWLGWPDVLKACLPPVLGGLGTLLLLAILYAGFVRLLPSVSFFAWIASEANAVRRDLAPGMETLINALVLGVVVIATVDRCRARLARRVDCGHRSCIGCGHDLRAVPSANEDRGTGRCSECGAGFVRPLAD
jgi:VanZ family protein